MSGDSEAKEMERREYQRFMNCHASLRYHRSLGYFHLVEAKVAFGISGKKPAYQDIGLQAKRL